jgi:ATP-dependent RNA helicase DeaD
MPKIIKVQKGEWPGPGGGGPPHRKGGRPLPPHLRRGRDAEGRPAEPELPAAEEPPAADEAPASFDELGLPEALLAAVKAAGFESPTPIQARSIPILLEGHDLIGQAQTGTGKTAAFALPMLARVNPAERHVQAIVLVPTRELAIQVAGQVHLLAKGTDLRVVPVYGGQPIDRQFRALAAGPQIVIGTPGRVLDHLRRASLDLSKATFCALDEADEMLAFGFIEDIETILAELPTEGRQTALFSATMPPRIAALVGKFLPNAKRVAIQPQRRTVEAITQTYYEVSPGKKLDVLHRVLDMETPGPTIVFCKTRATTDELADALRLRGYSADALHGDMAQPERDRVMRRFRDGQADILVATDVAARGLDIENVTHVVNYDMPWDVEQYIHRIGRTGRAGRSGDAITLVEPRERRNLRTLEQMIGARIALSRIPTAADIASRRRERFTEALRERLEKDDFDGQMRIVEDLSGEFDPASIAAVALQLLWEEQNAGRGTHEDEADEEIAAVAERAEAGMTRLFVGLGRQDGLRPADLVGAIAREVGLPGKAVGAIDILDRSAFVEVPADRAEEVIAVLSNTRLRNKRAKVGIALPRGARDGRGPDGDGDGGGRPQGRFDGRGGGRGRY